MEMCYIFKKTNDGFVAFSEYRIPFQLSAIKSEAMHRSIAAFKKELLGRIAHMTPVGNQKLHARYGTTDKAKTFYDLENVLFYNLGTSKFKVPVANGLSFSGISKQELAQMRNRYGIPDRYTHCYEYRLTDEEPDKPSPSVVMAFWESQPFCELRASSACDCWRAVKELADHIHVIKCAKKNSAEPFALDLTIEIPTRKHFNIATAMKPFLDGVICALHGGMDEFSDEELQTYADRLKCPKEWLENADRNILGSRKYIQQYPKSKLGIKWAPADDRCRRVCISIKEGDDLRTSATVSKLPFCAEEAAPETAPDTGEIQNEVPPCCPRCKKTKMAKILYGSPAYSAELQEEIDAGRLFLGGCMVDENRPTYHCRWCKLNF